MRKLQVQLAGMELDRKQFKESMSAGGAVLTAWGANVARARKRRKWSQDELAARCGVDPSTIWRIENAASRPSLWDIAHLAHVLDTSPARLFPIPTAATFEKMAAA